MADAHFDPRHLVTPDAFSVSEKALGLPLATGGRRLVAFALDGILVGLLALLGWRVLGVFLAFFFFRMATKRAPKSTDPSTAPSGVAARAAVGIGRGFRYSVGCLGALILFVVFVVGTGVVESLFRGDAADFVEVATNVIGAGRESLALENAKTLEEAENAVVEIGLALLTINPAWTLRETVESTTDDVPSSIDIDRAAFIARVEARIRERLPPGTRTASNVPALDDSLSLEAALAVYTESVTAPADVDEGALLAAARERIASDVAGDTLRAQESTIVELRDDLQRQEQAAADALVAAEESKGIFALFVEALDGLGLTFGWGALYFATLLTWFQGRTPGKRVMGLRVIRLDGEPISLYIAFERAGGYAAGLATGLLGFAQVLWDPNRQAIHDKIAGTVVIMDGKERLPGAGVPVP